MSRDSVPFPVVPVTKTTDAGVVTHIENLLIRCEVEPGQTAAFELNGYRGVVMSHETFALLRERAGIPNPGEDT